MTALTVFDPKRKFFNTNLTAKELEYMANSDNDVLLWIYYIRYKNAKKFNVAFDCEIVPKFIKRPIKPHVLFNLMIKWFVENPGDSLPNLIQKINKSN